MLFMYTQLQFEKKLDEVGKNIDHLKEKAGAEYREMVNELLGQKNTLSAKWRLAKNKSEDAWEKVEQTFASGPREIEDVYDDAKKKIDTMHK